MASAITASRRACSGDLRVGGSGPPLVCIHGFPQTHLTWRKVAPLLAKQFTVVLPDLRGYGASEIVPSDATHEPYSKRAMARDIVAVMRSLGHERFLVAGHDRGGRVAYRLALDAPERVAAVATLDIIPTLETYEAMDWRTAYNSYHWFFLAQPEPLPEVLIGADPAPTCGSRSPGYRRRRRSSRPHPAHCGDPAPGSCTHVRGLPRGLHLRLRRRLR